MRLADILDLLRVALFNKPDVNSEGRASRASATLSRGKPSSKKSRKLQLTFAARQTNVLEEGNYDPQR
jgi:flagellar basal body L-ring protein FlgH